MKVPKHLDEIGKATYKQVWTTLDSLGKLNEIDSHTVELYATLYSQFRMATDLIGQPAEAGGGIVALAKNGYPTPSPATKLRADAIKEMRGILRDWGVSKLIDRPEVPTEGDKWSAFEV